MKIKICVQVFRTTYVGKKSVRATKTDKSLAGCGDRKKEDIRPRLQAAVYRCLNVTVKFSE